MLPHAEAYEISEKMKRLTGIELRTKVREYPAIKERISKIRAKERDLGFPELGISEEGLISERCSALIGKLVCRTITGDERREFVELNTIRVELMVPEILRRRYARPREQV